MIARPWRLDDWMTRVRKDCSGCLWSLKSWVACCRHRLLWSRNYRGLSALSIISTSQALLSCWYVHCLMPSHHCGADLVQLYCIWRWPHLFILVALTEASTAGDGTDFHTQGVQAQQPVCHISCQRSPSPVSSHEPCTLSPPWPLRRGSVSRLVWCNRLLTCCWTGQGTSRWVWPDATCSVSLYVKVTLQKQPY